MKRIIFHTILIFSLLGAGCNKIDLPDPVDGEPVFTADLLLDGEETSLAAGVNGYYLFTAFEQGADDVYTFSGELHSQDSCFANSCPPSLAIHIRDYQQVSNGLPDIAGALALGGYAYRSDSLPVTGGTWVYDTLEVSYLVGLYADSSFASPANAQFYWEMDNGFEATGPSVFVLFPWLDPAPEVVLKYVEYTNWDSCVSSTTQRIRPPGEPTCAVSVQPAFDTLELVSLTAEPLGTAPFQFAWNTGDASPVLAGQSLVGMEEFSVLVTDATGCTASANFLLGDFDPDNPPENCRASFSYEVEPLLVIDSTFVPSSDTLQLSRVTLVYTSETGEEYRSDRFIQPGNAIFELFEVMDFDDNENGLPTKQFRLNLNCTLWNEAGQAIIVGPGSRAVWGVAYPD